MKIETFSREKTRPYASRVNLPEDQNPWTMQKLENLDTWPERHLHVYGGISSFSKVLVFLAKLVLICCYHLSCAL